MSTEDLIKKVDFLILKGNESIRKTIELNLGSADGGLWAGFRSASLSFIKNLYGENHPFYKEFNLHMAHSYKSNVDAGINVLLSIKNEIENGWLVSFKNLISAEVFSDFLEMGKYLLDQNYKDPAAVMIGSVLEEHLRFLCNNHSIETTFKNENGIKFKKADVLNSDLVKSGVYGVLEQKNVTAWLDLRNRAAHGKYEEYKLEQVELMYLGVLNFLISIK